MDIGLISAQTVEKLFKFLSMSENASQAEIDRVLNNQRIENGNQS